MLYTTDLKKKGCTTIVIDQLRDTAKALIKHDSWKGCTFLRT
jgi:hypothetical protein